MKYFQLFEQFIVESTEEELAAAKKEYEKLRAEFEKIDDDYYDNIPEYGTPERDKYEEENEEKWKKDREAAVDKMDQAKWKMNDLQRKANIEARDKKEAAKKEKKDSAGTSKSGDSVINKLRELEDEIESSVDYDFGAYPSSQIKKVMAGGDEAKEIIQKYTSKINDIKSELGDISNAMMDAKEDGDKEQLIQLKLELELRKAESELYAAIIKGEPKGLVTPLKKIQKINQKMDQLGSSDD